MTTNNLTREEIPSIIKNRESRIEVAKQSHMWFFHIYFPHYITYPTANFQKQFFALSEDEAVNPLSVMAFRGSAKSTIFNLSYPIWSILGKQGKKFVILLGQTQRQARQHLMNIKRELEGNELLKKDLGPFEEVEGEWGSYSLVLPWYNARISAASMEQTIRGMRHKQYRPDLIIADDIEDMASVKTREGREKIFNWISSEIIPAGDLNTRLIFIGNLLHEGCFLMRLKRKIENKDIDGQFIEIPLMRDGKISWPEKFTSLDEVRKLKRKINDKISWEREYMLRIISDEDRVVHPDWIQSYDYLPDEDDKENPMKLAAISVDLAISQKESADYTAIVSAKVWGYGEDMKIYIMPNPVNSRMTFPKTLDKIREVSGNLTKNRRNKIYVEDVGYQRVVVEALRKEGYPAEGISVAGQDKKARLSLTTPAIQSGMVLFPRKGAELLISQLTGFSKEKHDDLADAFSLLVNKIVADNKPKPRWPVMSTPDDDPALRPILRGIMRKQF